MTSHFLTFQVGVSSNYRKFNLEDLLGKNLKNCSAKLPNLIVIIENDLSNQKTKKVQPLFLLGTNSLTGMNVEGVGDLQSKNEKKFQFYIKDKFKMFENFQISCFMNC